MHRCSSPSGFTGAVLDVLLAWTSMCWDRALDIFCFPFQTVADDSDRKTTALNPSRRPGNNTSIAQTTSAITEVAAKTASGNRIARGPNIPINAETSKPAPAANAGFRQIIAGTE